MNLNSASFAAITLAFSLILTLIWRSRTLLNGIPGPFFAKLTRLWYLKHIYYSDFHTLNAEQHRKHGPIVQIRPNEYTIDDPDAVKIIYGARSRFVKSDWYYGSTPPLFHHVNIFSVSDPRQHGELRKMISLYYSMSYLSKYESFVDNNIGPFCDRLRGFARTGKPFNLGHWLQCFAFDVITEITLGRPFGFLDKGEDVLGLMASLETVQQYSAIAGLFPTLHHILAVYLKKDVVAPMTRFALKKVEERKASKEAVVSNGSEDFLTLFLKANELKPNEFPYEMVFGACTMNLTAGSDTTSISLSSIFYHLAKHPLVQEQLRAEINSAFPSKGKGSLFTYKEAQEMDLLQSVIKESMRLHPATGLPLSRRVPEGGATIAGRYFPANSIVGINAWVAHRNKSVFGEDAESFRPARWLEAEPDNLAKMEAYLIPFGVGSRTCIGKNISLLEISKVVPVLVRDFEFTLDSKAEAEWSKTSCEWFLKPKALLANVRER